MQSRQGRHGGPAAEAERDSFFRKTLVCLLRPHANSRSQVDNFGMDILQGLRDEISARHYRFIYHVLDESAYEQRVRDLVDGGMVAGVILDQFTPDETAAAIASRPVPAVLFNRDADLDNVSSVAPDYERVGRESLKTLLARGYERVAFYPKPKGTILESMRSAPTREIHRAFMAAAKAKGLPPERILEIPAVPLDDAKKPAPKLFGLPASKPASFRPLGVLTSFDVRGNQFMEAVEQTTWSWGGMSASSDAAILNATPAEPALQRLENRRLRTGPRNRPRLIRRIENPSRPRSIIKLQDQYLNRGSA